MCLQKLLTAVGLCIVTLEAPIEDASDNEVHKTASNAGPLSWLVTSRSVLGAEDETASDTANTTEANERGAAESTLPLTADIVCLEGHDGGDVCVGAGSDEENAEVANGSILGPAHDGETDEAGDHIEEDDGTTNMVLVTQPSCEHHHDTSKRKRWRNKTLRLGDIEAHASHKNDWERERKRIGQSRRSEEEQCVRPESPIGAGAQELLEVEGWRDAVAAVASDLVDDVGSLTGTEERPVLALRVGEVDEEPVASDGESAGQNTFLYKLSEPSWRLIVCWWDRTYDDEDPAPSPKSLATVKLLELSEVRL